MIKAIIFDFFGVICSDEYWRFVKLDRQTNSVFHEFADEVNLGDIPWQVFVQKIALATGSSVEKVNNMYEAEQLDPRVIGLIQELHKTYKIALLTNAHHDFIDEILKTNNLSRLFDEVIVSSRVGVIKPNPIIFEKALEKLGVLAEDVVYIDDLDRHVQAAKVVGMKSLQYISFEQCQHDLAKILSHS